MSNRSVILRCKRRKKSGRWMWTWATRTARSPTRPTTCANVLSAIRRGRSGRRRSAERLEYRLQPVSELPRLVAQFFEETLPRCGEIFFELFRAITMAAGPRLRAVKVAAILAGMSVADADQVEEFFPIR